MSLKFNLGRVAQRVRDEKDNGLLLSEELCMNKVSFMVFWLVLLSATLSGCRTMPQTPYEYEMTESDKLSVEDPDVHTEEMPRLKVAIRPARKSTGKKNIDEVVCAKVKGRVASSAYFEIAVRDDLANIEVEQELSGYEKSDVAMAPSELLVLVDACVTSYLGGTKPGNIARWQQARAEALARGKMDDVLLCDKALKNMQQTSVDSEKDAFGAAVSVTCSAYDCDTKRQYVSFTTAKNFYGDVVGRIDAVMDQASDAIAKEFVSKLSWKVAPAMKTDSLVTETRGAGAVAKVDTSAVRRKIIQGEKVVFYTHVRGKKGVSRREIASGTVWAVEEEAAWVKVSENRGYGNVKIGHCADFSLLP